MKGGILCETCGQVLNLCESCGKPEYLWYSTGLEENFNYWVENCGNCGFEKIIDKEGQISLTNGLLDGLDRNFDIDYTPIGDEY